MALLFGCMAAHVLLAHVVAAPWWVPNLTVAGLVVAVIRTPHRWIALSALAGLFAILFAVRLAGPLFVSYFLLGGTVRAVTTQWDTSDPRALGLLVGAASLLMAGYLVWLDGLWSLPILAGLLAHTAVTTLLVPVLRRCG